MRNCLLESNWPVIWLRIALSFFSYIYHVTSSMTWDMKHLEHLPKLSLHVFAICQILLSWAPAPPRNPWASLGHELCSVSRLALWERLRESPLQATNSRQNKQVHIQHPICFIELACKSGEKHILRSSLSCFHLQILGPHTSTELKFTKQNSRYNYCKMI